MTTTVDFFKTDPFPYSGLHNTFVKSELHGVVIGNISSLHGLTRTGFLNRTSNFNCPEISMRQHR